MIPGKRNSSAGFLTFYPALFFLSAISYNTRRKNRDIMQERNQPAKGNREELK
jgi:hypothetical protein